MVLARRRRRDAAGAVRRGGRRRARLRGEEEGHVPDVGPAASDAELVVEHRLAQGGPLPGTGLQQHVEHFDDFRRQDFDQVFPIAAPHPALGQQAAQAEAAEVFKELALPALRGGPGVVLGDHGIDHGADGEGVRQEGVHDPPCMNLWGLVQQLADNLVAHFTLQCRHAEVDEPQAEPRAVPRQHDILQRQVPMGDAQVVQPAHGRQQLRRHGPHPLLALGAWSRQALAVTPIEEVPLRAERRRHEGLALVTEDAAQVAGIRVRPLLEDAKEGEVGPRLLRGPWVLARKVRGVGADPRGRHPLHCEQPAVGPGVPCELHLPVVPDSRLQVPHDDDAAAIP
mmetsp:Transcript_114959/g.321267  ORF Transcript_114959/g.321267 Transcript_114959/m.321267 type:complete len:340 (-) Transcript_114959:255-1274(-)